MSRLEVKENPLESLENLVGGKLIAEEISGYPGDPEEDSAQDSGIVFGKKDLLDVLEVCVGMEDHTGFGILMRCVSLPELHRRDEEVVGRELENERRMS